MASLFIFVFLFAVARRVVRNLRHELERCYLSGFYSLWREGLFGTTTPTQVGMSASMFLFAVARRVVRNIAYVSNVQTASFLFAVARRVVRNASLWSSRPPSSVSIRCGAKGCSEHLLYATATPIPVSIRCGAKGCSEHVRDHSYSYHGGRFYSLWREGLFGTTPTGQALVIKVMFLFAVARRVVRNSSVRGLASSRIGSVSIRCGAKGCSEPKGLQTNPTADAAFLFAVARRVVRNRRVCRPTRLPTLRFYSLWREGLFGTEGSADQPDCRRCVSIRCGAKGCSEPKMFIKNRPALVIGFYSLWREGLFGTAAKVDAIDPSSVVSIRCDAKGCSERSSRLPSKASSTFLFAVARRVVRNER